jgi:ABC-type multidrug transport system fused ATPase/permease subunit
MSLYAITVFLHVVGALGLFVALGLEWAGLRGVRRAVTNDHVRQWIQLLGSLERLASASALTVLVTGVYMSATAWGRQPWIGLGLVGLLLIVGIGSSVTGRRIRALARAIPRDDGSVPGHLLRLLRDPVLLLSAWLRTALGLGVVFLMTAKPGSAASLTAILVSVAIGAGTGLPAWLRAARPASIVGAADRP